MRGGILYTTALKNQIYCPKFPPSLFPQPCCQLIDIAFGFLGTALTSISIVLGDLFGIAILFSDWFRVAIGLRDLVLVVEVSRDFNLCVQLEVKLPLGGFLGAFDARATSKAGFGLALDRALEK